MSVYYGGWAMEPDYLERAAQVTEWASKVDAERDIESFIKTPVYGKTHFEGKLKPGSKVSEIELLAWADGGCLCFGGQIELDGYKFRGSFNVD